MGGAGIMDVIAGVMLLVGVYTLVAGLIKVMGPPPRPTAAPLVFTVNIPSGMFVDGVIAAESIAADHVGAFRDVWRDAWEGAESLTGETIREVRHPVYTHAGVYFRGGLIDFVPSTRPHTREAVARGHALLRQFLTPEQRETLPLGYFDVVGGDSRNKYRIYTHAQPFNIQCLRTGAHYCATLNDSTERYVVGDVLLAQKMGLELDETETLRVANRMMTMGGCMVAADEFTVVRPNAERAPAATVNNEIAINEQGIAELHGIGISPETTAAMRTMFEEAAANFYARYAIRRADDGHITGIQNPGA